MSPTFEELFVKAANNLFVLKMLLFGPLHHELDEHVIFFLFLLLKIFVLRASHVLRASRVIGSIASRGAIFAFVNNATVGRPR